MPNTPTPSTGPDSANTPAPKPDIAADANAILAEAKTKATEVADEARDQVAGLADLAKTEMSEATDKVKSMAADQKELLADQVGGLAEALRRATTDLEQTNGASANYARMIADNAEKLSATIRDNDVDQLMGMAQDFGRRQPVAFMGAAALLGFAASRFVLASAKRREQADAAAEGDSMQSSVSTPGYGQGAQDGSYGTNPGGL